MSTSAAKPEKKESLFLSLIFNLAIPTLILTKFSSPDSLGPFYALIIGLAFPFFYGVYDFISRSKFNFVSLLGIISVGLTGGFSLMELDAHWIAIKEAAIPLVLGCFVLGSVTIKKPLIKLFFFKAEIMQVEKIEQILKERGNQNDFETLLSHSTALLSVSFFMSSILNYVLAKWILLSEPGTEAFNVELGKMTALSYPIIFVPSMVVFILVLWHLLRGIKKLTGLTLEEAMHNPKK